MFGTFFLSSLSPFPPLSLLSSPPFLPSLLGLCYAPNSGPCTGRGEFDFGQSWREPAPALWGDLIPREKTGSQKCFLKFPSLYVDSFFLGRQEVERKKISL